MISIGPTPNILIPAVGGHLHEFTFSSGGFLEFYLKFALDLKLGCSQSVRLLLELAARFCSHSLERTESLDTVEVVREG